MMKTLEGSLVQLVFSDGEKTHTIKGVLQSIFIVNPEVNNNAFLIIKVGEQEHFIALFYVICITVLKPKAYRQEKEKPLSEDMAIL